MAKDPAFLFYYQDFAFGTQFMSDADTGIYIRILCNLADKGTLSKEQVLSICKASAIPESIQEKLSVDEKGRYYQDRLLREMEKRKVFTESRRKNALGEKAYAQHMGDGNRNENRDVVVKEKKITEKDFEPVWKLYPNRQGRKPALTHFLATVKQPDDLTRIRDALRNYLASGNVAKGFIKNGSTWFNEWQDWVEPTDVMMKGNADANNGRNSFGQSGTKKSGAGGASTNDDIIRTVELAKRYSRDS